MIKCAAEIGILTKNVKFRLEKPELGERLVVSGGMKADVRRVTPPSHARPCADLAKTPNMRNILYIQQCIHRV